jgi:hypothetical protein
VPAQTAWRIQTFGSTWRRGPARPPWEGPGGGKNRRAFGYRCGLSGSLGCADVWSGAPRSVLSPVQVRGRRPGRGGEATIKLRASFGA